MDGKRRLQDSVFGIIPGQGPKAGKGQGTNPHQTSGLRHVFINAAHPPHVLFIRHGMNDRAGSKEQQRLEKSMGEKMENRHRIGTDAQGEKHIAQLAAGRIGDHPLDIILHQTHGCRKEGGGAADDGDHDQGGGRKFEHRRTARHQKNARRYHGGRMDQGADRGRPLHGIRQPGMQGHLGRLTHGADKQQDANGRHHIPFPAQEIEALANLSRSGREDRVEIQRAKHREDRHDPQGKAKIADPVNQKGLDRGGIGGRSMIPKADQQIGGQTNPFPAKEQLQEIIRRHQHQHGEGEQR